MMCLDWLDVLQQQIIQGFHARRICLVEDAARMPKVDSVLPRQQMMRFVVVVDIWQADVVAAQIEPRGKHQ